MTELTGHDVRRLHDLLSLSEFRRSHGIAYVPNCPTCQACIPLRVVADDFEATRTQRKIRNRNADLQWQECEAMATVEQYELFTRYQEGRHTDGEMSKMDFEDYLALVEDTPIETTVVEFRDANHVLVGVCLADRINDGLSAVYSFFDPAQDKRSLGTYMVLWLIDRAHSLELPYVYLGYWIKESPKMSYKANFGPCQLYMDGKWRLA